VLEILARNVHARAEINRDSTIIRENEFVEAIRAVKKRNVEQMDIIEYVADKTGVIKVEDPSTYRFAHRTFQEHLAACDLLCHADASLHPNELVQQVLDDPERWREVLRHGLDMLAVRDTSQSALWLALQLLTQDSAAHPLPAALALDNAVRLKLLRPQKTNANDFDWPRLSALRDVSLRLLIDHERLLPAERAACGRALSLLGDPRKGVGVKDGLPDIDWVTIPDDGPFPYGKARTEIRWPVFKIARYPLTYAQFEAFLTAADGWENDAWWHGLAATPNYRQKPGRQRLVFDNHPREAISWYDAIAFCRWLSARLTQLHGVPVTIRLPYEQEWEKACRGGTATAYPWGDDYLPGHANINEVWGKSGTNDIKTTSAVGMYPQGASTRYGVQDMIGNAWEWCQNESSDPTRVQDEGDAARVLRGGSWGLNHEFARVAYRDYNFPYFRGNDCGVRVVCAPVPPPVVSDTR
jgi:formylglycine-generating enzyme required for sulfatase activity